MIDRTIQRNSTYTQDDASHSSGGGLRRPVQPTRVCSYTDFMKCQPLNFKGTEVKFATCTLQDAALSWWNGHVRTLGHDAAYFMTWGTLKKKLTNKYCPKGEIKKLEIELWNLRTEKVDKYISGLPDNIHRNVMYARPKTLDDAIELANDLMDQKLLPTGRYVVPTGRVVATDSVIVATSGYVVPAAYDISPGLRPTSGIRAWRESLLKNTYCYCFYIVTMTSPYPTPPFTGPSPSDSSFSIPTTSEPVFSMATTEPVFQAQTSSSAQPLQNPQPQYQQYNSTTVSSSNAKFPYLKKEEYETWAMKMEYWIMNTDHNLWNIVLQGNSRKRTGRDPRGNIMILPPVTMEEQIAVQREIKARTILLQSLPEDHMADFHHLDDAKDIWLAVKARFGGNEELKKMRKNEELKKMRKSMLKQEFADFKITESEGLHKGYDRFQKVLSQLNQMQARPDNEDCNMKFLRALPPSWSQVAITLKTKGGLDFLSFDDLYNKLRTLEIDVKGGSSYDSRVPAAPTHSAFISAASTNSKWSTADSKGQPSTVNYTTTSSSVDVSGNVLENVLHSFVAESDPRQQITYEDFDQIGKFEKKAGRKFKFNNKDAARFDKTKVRCYQCSELGHFARECTGKKVDSKTRYSQFKIKELDKSEESKALVSVDSMLNWSDHKSEVMEKGASEVYGMIAGYGDDAVIPAVDAADEVSTSGVGANGVFVAAGVGADDVSITSSDATDAETQFALMGLSPQAKIDKMNNQAKLEESNARFDKWKESSKNLVKLINSSMSSRSKFGLGYGDTFGSDEVFDLSAPSIFDSCLKDAIEKPLYDWFVKPVGMHAVPPPITGTFMPPSNKPDIDDTQFTYGSKSNNCVETNSVSNDFVSCDNSDKSSDSESAGFASCASSVNSSSTMTNASSSVDLKTLHKTDDQGPCNVTQSPSFSFKENVKTPRNLCNRNGSNNISLCKNKSFGSKKCFVCGSKFHLIRDCDFYENQLRLNNAPVWKNVENIPSFVPRPAYVPAGSRNRPTSVPAGRPFPAGWHNPAARPMTRPKSHYFQQFSRPGSYNQMVMDGGRWGTAVKTSA
ncbi:ribonuclease H-like domain-containing protein, partial [Tanacetum coccineum]